LRETFFDPSAWARQDAAPPEVALDLLNKHRVTSGGAACWRVAGWEIIENRWFSAGFRFPESSRAGRPRPQWTPAFPSVSRFPVTAQLGWRTLQRVFRLFFLCVQLVGKIFHPERRGNLLEKVSRVGLLMALKRCVGEQTPYH
jgi:hypothetical protein